MEKNLTKPMEGFIKIQSLLKDHTHLYAKEISEAIGLSNSAVWGLIRKLRIKGIGIMTTNKGYILADKASKADDINFLRRLHGRRASDLLAIQSCQGAIQKRWNSDSDRKLLLSMSTPLASPKQYLMAKKGMAVVLTLSSELKKGMKV